MSLIGGSGKVISHKFRGAELWGSLVEMDGVVLCAELIELGPHVEEVASAMREVEFFHY